MSLRYRRSDAVNVVLKNCNMIQTTLNELIVAILQNESSFTFISPEPVSLSKLLEGGRRKSTSEKHQWFPLFPPVATKTRLRPFHISQMSKQNMTKPTK